MVGSVWSGSPLARMQVAHWSISWVALPPFGVVVVLPPPWPPPAVVLVPRLATCGEFGEPPLHAFNPMAAAATAAAHITRRPPRARLPFSEVLAAVTSSSRTRTVVRNGRSHAGHTCDRGVTRDLRFCSLGEVVSVGRHLSGRSWCHAGDQEK